MLRVALLGHLEVQLDQDQVQLHLRPVQLLLAYLLLNRDRAHQREQLAGVLWPGYTESSARKNLRNTLYRLRKAIGEDYLVVDRASVAFNTAAEYWLDVEQLELALSSTEIETLMAAAAAYRGELLPGLYEEWISWERERLQTTFDQVLATLLQQLAESSRWDESITWAESWIAQGAVPEAAYRALMRAHAANGDRSAMSMAYRRAVRALQDELGVPPAAETERLYQKLLAGGGHESMPVETVAGSDTPMRPGTQGNLPQHATAFIGRQKEVAELREMLSQASGRRLITIVGPGGIGKTRLSVEAAAAAAGRFADGVFFVRLAPLTDPQDMVSAISDSIGYRSAGGDPRLGLLEYLAQKELLLVLDNCEHLLSGFDLVGDVLRSSSGARFMCTSRQRLNLSGEAVYVLSGLDYPAAGGQEADDIRNLGAVQLLLEQARLARPGLHPSAAELADAGRISRLVQGMPLALVLAASWLEMLAFDEIAYELESSLDILESQTMDMPERQRSMRAAFDYSWRRLTAEEQAIFGRLSVFRGGFGRRAAEKVAGAGLTDLRLLIEKSLVVAEGRDRYAVHELLRQFAEERLVASGLERPVLTAHSRYYLDALADRLLDLKGRRQLEALDEIEVSLDNVRAAWAYALESNDFPPIDSALETLSLFCHMQARHQEAWRLLQPVLDRLAPGQPLPSEMAIETAGGTAAEADFRARLWGRLATRSVLHLAHFNNTERDLERMAKQGLAIAEAHDDLAQIAHAHLALGHYHSRVTGDFAKGAEYFRVSLDKYSALADVFYEAQLLHRIGYAAEYSEGAEAMIRYTAQSLDLARKIGSVKDTAHALGNLGGAYMGIGDYKMGEACLRESVELDSRLGDSEGMAHNTIQMAVLHLLNGRFDLAQEQASHGYALARKVASPTTSAYGLAALSLLASLDGDYRQGWRLASDSLSLFTNEYGSYLGHWAQSVALMGLDQLAEALGEVIAALELGHKHAWHGTLVWPLPVVAVLLAKQGQPERAAEVLGLYFSHPLKPAGWAERWQILTETQAELERSLGENVYRRAWNHGREQDLATVLEELITGE